MRAAVRAAVVVVALVSSGCGKSPTSPSPTPSPSPLPAPAPTPTPTLPNLDGQWSGRMVFTFKGEPNKFLGGRVDLRQAERTITGSYVVSDPPDNDVHGDITGTLEGTGSDTQFSGEVTFDAPSEIGTRCLARATFTGSAARAPLRWTAPRFTFQSGCSDPEITDVVWTLSR